MPEAHLVERTGCSTYHVQQAYLQRAAVLAAAEAGHMPLGQRWGWALDAFWVHWATERVPAAASGAADLWPHMTHLVPYKAVHGLDTLAASALQSC